jgi:hypothetical protein
MIARNPADGRPPLTCPSKRRGPGGRRRPWGLHLVVSDREMTLAEFTRRYPSTVPVREIALLNQLAEGGTVPAGASAKRVVGGRGID